MSELISYRLNEIAEFSKGINYSSSDYTENGTGITFITIKSILKGGGYDKTGLKTIRNRFTQQDLLSEDDLLIAITDLTRDGDIVGSPIIIPKHLVGSVASMDLVRIIPNESITCTRYLCYFLMLPTTRRYFVNHSSGSTVLHLETKSIPKLTIPLLSLDDQKRVVKILSTVDEVIEKTEAAIEKYQAIKAGMMQDLFTRGINTQTGKLRPTIEEAPELYKESELGWIPREWEIATLSEVCGMRSGDGITSKSIDEYGSYPVYGGNGLRGYTANYTHEGSYVLIGRQGALCGNVKRVDGIFYASEHAVVVSVNSDTNVDWMSYILESMNLNTYSEASAQPGLAVGKILCLRIRVPQLTEQSMIASVIQSLNTKIEAETALYSEYNKIKQGLMADLLTGTVKTV